MSVVRGRPPGLAGGIIGASRAYCSSLRACPAPKSPTSARLSVVHMACLQEGLLPSRTGRRPACATRSPRRRRLLKRPLRGTVAERIAAIEGFAQAVLRDLGMPDREGWYVQTADGGWRTIAADQIQDWLREQGTNVSALRLFVERACGDEVGVKAAEVIEYADQLKEAIAR